MPGKIVIAIDNTIDITTMHIFCAPEKVCCQLCIFIHAGYRWKTYLKRRLFLAVTDNVLSINISIDLLIVKSVTF